jgi:hypothetical protein
VFPARIPDIVGWIVGCVHGVHAVKRQMEGRVTRASPDQPAWSGETEGALSGGLVGRRPGDRVDGSLFGARLLRCFRSVGQPAGTTTNRCRPRIRYT